MGSASEPSAAAMALRGRAHHAARSHRSGRVAAVSLAFVLVTGLVACSASDKGSSHARPPSPTVSFDPAASSRLFPPAGARSGKTPVIVLVPGGGWTSADPTGLTGLATWLSQRGAAVVTVTYRTSSDGAYFPVPAQDVACDVADAVARTRRSGVDVGEVVIVGHSAGAQLAAVVALTPGAFSAGCADPLVAPDRLVGLAGPYDVGHLGSLSSALLGPGRHTAAEIAAANPVTLATQRPQLPVLLIHGTADTTVPTTSTEELAAALTAAGHPVTTDYPNGVGHQSVYSAPVAGPLIATWLRLAG